MTQGATWQAPAFGTGGSDDSLLNLLFQIGYGSDSNGFSVNLSGFYQVWDFVTWNQHPGIYELDPAGTHIFQRISGPLNTSDFTYADWCYFSPGGA